MICITCNSAFHRRPFHYYFCSQTCWDDAIRNTSWRILSDGFAPFIPPVKFTTSSRYPRAHGSGQRARGSERLEVPLSRCSNVDCKEVQSSAVLEKPEGLIQFTGEVVGYQDRRVKNSPDGEYHWCAHRAGIDAGQTICLFVPPKGF